MSMFDVAETEVRDFQRAVRESGGTVTQSSPVAVGYQMTVVWPDEAAA